MTDALATHTPRRGQGARGPKDGELDWTPARVNTLILMWADGHSQSAIADELGLKSRGAVSGKIARLGLSKPVQHSRKITRRPSVAGEHHGAVILPVGRLTLEELTDHVCKFPVGDGPNYLFCGEPTDFAPYCASCCAIAYRDPNNFRERKALAMPI